MKYFAYCIVFLFSTAAMASDNSQINYPMDVCENAGDCRILEGDFTDGDTQYFAFGYGIGRGAITDRESGVKLVSYRKSAKSVRWASLIDSKGFGAGGIYTFAKIQKFGGRVFPNVDIEWLYVCLAYELEDGGYSVRHINLELEDGYAREAKKVDYVAEGEDPATKCLSNPQQP